MSGALTAVTNNSAAGPGSTAPMGTSGSQATTAFNNAVSSSTNQGLTINGNQIDTGRYIISSSNAYTSPTAGIQANDGMVSIYDKQTGSYMDVYGDPHVYTSAGDRAQFQANGLTLNLGDGTQLQFRPTAETNGVSHIGEVAVSKGGQTVVESGFNNSGAVSSGPITQGGPSSSQGFNNSQDTVLHTGSDGSLGTLYNAKNDALNSTTSEQSLDGMGGGATSAQTQSEVADLQKLISLLQQQISTSQAAGQDTQGMQNLVSKLEELVSKLVSSQGSGGSGDMATLVNQLLPALEQQLGQLGQSGQGQSQEASLINKTISTLMGMADGGTSTASGTGTGTTSASSGTGAPTSAGAPSNVVGGNPYISASGAPDGSKALRDAITGSLYGGTGINFDQYMQAVESYSKQVAASQTAAAASTQSQNNSG